jgi:hypothetical protein
VTRLLETKYIFVAALFLGIFSMAARNVTDPDLWWHLKTGEYIAAHQSVPHTDPFSYTRSGQRWVAHEWLSELLIYDVQRTTAWGGLIVVFAVLVSAAFFLLYVRCGPDPYIAGVVVLCGAWATQMLWGVRPQVISLLFTSLWLLILERAERNPKLLWWTLPLTLLWVNLHAGFALGLALSALFIAGDWVERRLGIVRPEMGGARLPMMVLLLDLVLVFFNPNGARMYLYPIETLRSQAMQAYLAEWASPNFHKAEYWPLLALLLVAFAMLAWARSSVRPRDLLLLVVSLYAALCAIRMIALFVLIVSPLICRGIGDLVHVRSSRARRLSLGRAWANAIIVLGMAVFAGVHVRQVIQRQPQAEAELFPERAAAYLQAHPSSAPIFNHYDWGGYLIWKLYPQARVFIDGRADLYGEDFLNEFAKTYELKDDWRRTLERWGIKTVIIPTNSALAQGLRVSPGWTILYQDSEAIVLWASPH